MKTLNFPVRYSVSTVLSNLIFLRVYLLGRLFTTMSEWTTVESEEMCEREGFQVDFWFSIKSIMKRRKILSLIVNFMISVVVFGFAVRSFERYAHFLLKFAKEHFTKICNTRIFHQDHQSTLTITTCGIASG